MTIPSYLLNDGVTIPAIGFGTYKLTGNECTQSVLDALAIGYRLIDTAVNYYNEEQVGQALKQTEVPREEIFVTTKIPGRFHGYEKAIECVKESVTRLGVDQIDLVLIHWPIPRIGLYADTWKGLVAAQQLGLVRSVGVSNFLPEHLERIISETGVVPVINQIERHPYWPQFEQLAWDSAHGIRDQAWSPLYRGLIDAPELGEIAANHSKSEAQVVLRWDVQSGVLPIPKAATRQRQQENLAIFDFELTANEVATIDSLGRTDLQTSDPRTAEFL